MAVINNISRREEQDLQKCIKPYTYDIKDQNTKTATLIVRAPGPERADVKRDLEKKLKTKKYDFYADRSGGSIGATNIKYGDYTVKIIYKPLSGGMSETTLNSTITELAPAIAFMANKNFTDHLKFHAFLVESLKKGNQYGCYLNDQDLKAGHAFIKDMPSSSKFKEKMENAMAVLKYLKQLDKEAGIKQVYFAYRAKPTGIASDHKGDLFVEFKNGKMLGVSLKAGGAKTAEPQLNTYVNKMLDDFNRPNDKNALRSKVHKAVHSKLGLNPTWMEAAYKSEAIEIIESFREEKPQEYEKLYDKMLDLCRDAVIDTVNKNKKDAEKYIVKKIIKKDENVPLVVVKAVGKNYKMVTDEDVIETFMPSVTKIEARKSTTSKQEWFIDLISKGDKMTMKMSIRTNQPPPKNKIAQGFNLAVKFNGIA